MKKTKMLSVLFTVLLMMTACAVPAAAPPTAVLTPEEFTQWVGGEITSPALTDNLIGDPDTKKYMVYLPPSYPEGNKYYPVAYVLHFFNGSHTTLIGIGLDLDEMIANGDAPEMIIVFPNAKNAFNGSLYSSSPTIGDYRTYLAQDFVNHIDENFRTIPHSDSRGITGCSMGGTGAIDLALTYPDVFGVTAGVSGKYQSEGDPSWESTLRLFKGAPSDFSEFRILPWQVQGYMAKAAVASPNPDKPPFFLDMPFEMVDGEPQIVTEVADKINDMGSVHLLQDYLEQPIRLRAMMLYHGKQDAISAVDGVRSFSETLSKLGINHEYLEVSGNHCDLSYDPVIQFMAENLSFEMPQ